MSLHKDFCKALVDFTKSVKTLENCCQEISKNMEEVKTMGDKTIKTDLEREIYASELKQIKLVELEKKASEFNRLIISKLHYENIMEELKNYKEKMDEKVTSKVNEYQQKLQDQLTNNINSQKNTSEKEILEAKLELAEQKLDYICKINNFENFKKVTFTNPIVEEVENQ